MYSPESIARAAKLREITEGTIRLNRARLTEILHDIHAESTLYGQIKYAPISDSENAAIRDHWKLMSGESCYFDAVCDMLHKSA